MGVRGEIFSTRLILPNRTYFLNIKENRMGDLYLNIVESKNKETGGFDRQSVIVFADDLPAFLGEFDKALKILEKQAREQKQGGGKRRDTAEGSDRPGRSRRAVWEGRDTGKENRRPERNSRPDGKRREDRESREGRYDKDRYGGGRKDPSRKDTGRKSGEERNRPNRDKRIDGKRVVVKRR